LTPLLTGLGLAAAAGWNAWAVLLFFNGVVRLLPQEFPGPTASFLSSPPVLQIAFVLFLAEFIVGKIPVVDRLWELGQTLLRPLAGAFLALAASAGTTPAALAATAAGGAASTLAAHLVKSTTRWTSTAATRGLAQLALSLAEDVVAIVLAILVFFVPWFAVVLLVALAVLLVTHRVSVGHAVRVLFLRLQHPRRALRQAARRG
jgi:uncharacterized protein DUF4126